MVDPRPTDSNGERKITVTPQMVHDIFEEHPVVAKAYSENVPNQVSIVFLGRDCIIETPNPSCVSLQRVNFGSAISSLNYLIAIVLPYAQAQLRILFAKIPFWTSI